ncbi:MAG: CCA tRNA nucleotidyltransferase [Gudongella sp.]|nr:CCA tRNA nucleotidyltransferase [Gudongella sp.]
MKILMPNYVNIIIEKLIKNGFRAYLVGGSVRDTLLNKQPNDYDITTSATPKQIIELFSEFKTLEIGKEFGTIVIIQDEGGVEVTSFRQDNIYEDGRRPSSVVFTEDLMLDLKRRDFTINSMAYNEDEGLIDPFDGFKDLKKKLIRTVGNPIERLSEDYLRILRAVRFACQLDFLIDLETSNACSKLSSNLAIISTERIRDELFKILLSEKPSRGFLLMREMGILKQVIPELMPAIGFDQRNPYHDRSVFQHTLKVMDNTPKILNVRLAALLHDIGKPYTFTMDTKGIGHFYGHDKASAKIGREILLRLNCSTDLMESTLNLIKEHMVHHPDLKRKGLKRQLQRIGEEQIENLIYLQIADRLSKSGAKDISSLEAKRREVRSILESKEPFSRKHLAIDGEDLINLGFKEGRIIGEILDFLLNCVIDDSSLNTKKKLKEIVKNKYPLQY